MDTTFIHREPLGVCLVMGAWNYPVQLSLQPVSGAIASGNCVVIKPSELAPATAKVIETLVAKYLDPASVVVINGGIPETSALLKEKFDHIFFTGGTNVGKIVAEAASKTLTPCILELGGRFTKDAILAAQKFKVWFSRKMSCFLGWFSGPQISRQKNHLGQNDQSWPNMRRSRLHLMQFKGFSSHCANDQRSNRRVFRH